jgi:hypothetical protein
MKHSTKSTTILLDIDDVLLTNGRNHHFRVRAAA